MYRNFMGFLCNFERWKHVLAGNEGQNNKIYLDYKVCNWHTSLDLEKIGKKKIRLCDVPSHNYIMTFQEWFNKILDDCWAYSGHVCCLPWHCGCWWVLIYQALILCSPPPCLSINIHVNALFGYYEKSQFTYQWLPLFLVVLYFPSGASFFTSKIYNYQGVVNEDYNIVNTPAPNGRLHKCVKRLFSSEFNKLVFHGPPFSL